MSQTDPASDWQVGSRFIGEFTDNQLAVSQVADWPTRQQQFFLNHKINTLFMYITPSFSPSLIKY